jgi:tRNA nucleotidyltransferase (CCA-adding enzyme)
MHKIEKSLIPKQVVETIQKMTTSGYQCYVVGGAVRDLLLGRSTRDWDFTTNATPEQILEVFKDGYYNNSFGTVGVAVEESDLEPFEITTYRTESNYSDNRRPDNVSWGKSLEEDVSRRDFTINSMALSIDQDLNTEIIDHHLGLKDLEQKLLRTVGDPDTRFKEDALRMMRAVRIATELGFKIEEGTEESVKRNAELINNISKERIKEELWKILAAPDPVDGIKKLISSGICEIVLPELLPSFEIDQKSPERHHTDDVGTHLLKSLANCRSQDPLVRFATLIHDIGKPQTHRILSNGVVTFYNHEVVGSRIAAKIAERLKFSKQESSKLFKLVRWHQFTVDENQTDSAVRRFIRNVGIENIEDMLTLRIADRLGGGARETSWRLEEFKKRLIDVQKQPFSVRDLKITGSDLMEALNIPQGKLVGVILNKLFSEVEVSSLANEREELLSRAKELYSELI